MALSPSPRCMGHVEGLSANGPGFLFKDLWNDIWVGTSRGLDRFRQPNLVRINEFESNDTALTICPSGEVWAANWGGPVRSIKQGIEIERLPKRTSYLLYCDPSNVVWHVDQAAFSRFKNNVRESLPPPGQYVWLIRQVVTDGQGGLFASVLRNGLWRFSNDAWTSVQADGLPKDTPTALFNGPDGRLWTGYINNSVAVLAGTHAQSFSLGDRGAVGIVLAFCNTKLGLIAAGTNGIAVLRDNHFQPIIFANPTAGRGVSGILAAGNGDLWLNGAHGIARIRASEIEESLAEPQHPVRAELFLESGIQGPSGENGVPTAAMDSTGLMWFATSNALVTVDPSRVRSSESQPILGPLAVTVDSVPVLPPYIIRHGNHTIRIKYQGAYLPEPQRVVYQTKLDGLDKDWQFVGDRSEAVYTALRAGAYQFHAIGSNNGDVWTAPDVTLTFQVQPAFYQSRWFQAVSLMSLIFALWLIYSIRLRQMTRQVQTEFGVRMRERERIARELHDTLIQSTQGLILIFHGFAGRLQRRDPMRDEMQLALDRADNLLNEARHGVADIRTPGFDPDMVRAIVRSGTELFAGTGVDYSVTVAGDPPPLFPTASDDIYRIGREALTNAAKHANAKTVHVDIIFLPTAFRMRIRDDGKGFDAVNTEAVSKPGHFGLTGMRERTQRIGGTLQLEARKGAGVAIEIVVPAKQIYLNNRNLFSRLLSRTRK